jgi:hypothetical protein
MVNKEVLFETCSFRRMACEPGLRNWANWACSNSLAQNSQASLEVFVSCGTRRSM